MFTRVISLMLAVTFFLTTVGFSAYVIWEGSRNNDDEPLNSSTTQQTVEELIEDATTEQSEQQTEEQTATKEEGNMLEGTQLQGFTASTDRVADLQIIDTVEGSGDSVPEGGTVTVHYTGAVVATGVIFQSSKDTGAPITFGLNGVIDGWTEGVPGMKAGGTRRLVIPAAKAYGQNPPPGIPVDADLVFDIEMVSFAQ